MFEIFGAPVVCEARNDGAGNHAPASPDRAKIVPRTHAVAATECGEAAVTGRQRAMSWAQRLKRVFAIDIETCRQCGGKLRVIAWSDRFFQFLTTRPTLQGRAGC
jgi:hypothetical protein